MPQDLQNSSNGLSKVLYSVCAVLIVVILGLGGYYLYSSGTLSKLGFSNNNSKTGAPTTTPIPTPIKQAVRQDITPETDFGSCSDLKNSPLIKRVDLIEKGGDYILTGILRGKVQSLVSEPGFGQFNLVPGNEGSASKLIKLKEKAVPIKDSDGKELAIKDLRNGLLVEVSFNCTRNSASQNSFLTLNVIVDRGNLDH